MIHSRDVEFNENEKKSEEGPNSDQNHHRIVDFSDPQPQAESQIPEESAPEQEVRRSSR